MNTLLFSVCVKCLALLLLVLTVGFAGIAEHAVAVQPEQRLAIPAQVADFLKKWRPMSKPLRDSYPQIRMMIAHRMTKEQIRQYLDKSVAIREREEFEDLWYIPVMPSQGFDLRFDALGRLEKVDVVGQPVVFKARAGEDIGSLEALPPEEYAVRKIRTGAAFSLANYADQRPIFDQTAAQWNTPEEILTRADRKTSKMLVGLLEDRAIIPLAFSYSPEYHKYDYRVCDYAMFLLLEVLGQEPESALSKDPVERDKHIEILKKQAEAAIPKQDPPWGKPADGLKCRLLPAARTITVLERAKAEDVRIYLTYELQNVGEKPAKFLPWDTPLEEGGRGLECMGPDGNEAKYRGKYVDRGVPDAKHFLTIRPGQTLARSFRLPYDLSEPGTYTVSLRPGRPGRFEWIIKSYYGGDAEKAKQNSDNVWTGTITSNTVTVQILHATLQPAKKQEDTISERIR